MGWRLGNARFLPLACYAAFGLATAPAWADEPSAYSWRGFYLGYHLGGALDLADVGDPFGASLFGDRVRAPGPSAGGQLGYNWHSGAVLLGIEADASFADLDGTNTCFAVSGTYISSNCRVHVDAFGTLAGRLGYALPGDGRTLLYAKGGLAWVHAGTAAKPNGGAGLPGTFNDGVAWGWTLGAGIERAIGPRWTLKAEYDFLSVDERIAVPASLTQPAPPLGPLVPTNGTRTGVAQDLHAFKLGMNYRLAPAQNGEADLAPDPVRRITVTAGARYVHGWGQFHKDLGIPQQRLSSLASRLTYDTTPSDGGEAFARVDLPWGLMAKGFIGGASGGGKLNDEDWGVPFPTAFVPYSNTISEVENDITYGVVDVGYAWWRRQRFSVALYLGYTQLREDMEAYGCRQIANQFSDCVPPLPTSTLGITEDDKWHGLRLGSAIDFAVTSRLALTADAAYLPYVTFSGVDDHVIRDLVSPEDGRGIGVQLEASLSYLLTESLSVGVGGRYWSFWTTDGEVNFGRTGTIVPMRFASEQAQLLVQGAYKFGVPLGR
jgi:opacity protein-like surface antigen